MKPAALIVILIIFLCACTVKDEDCDCPDKNAGDDTGLQDDDSTPFCVEGERRCGEDSIPETCEGGQWVAQDPCPDWTYCNFGQCAEAVLDLPKDESPHQALVEWWYWTGNFRDDAGNLYGFEITFFFGGRAVGISEWMINVAAIDVSAGVHEEDSWLDNHPADTNPEALHLASRDASADLTQPGFYHLVYSTQTYTLNLDLEDLKGPSYHGGVGAVRMSSRASDSFYYSRTRMELTGTISVAGQDLAVTGEAWMDHQWGDFNPFVLIGWDWYSMRFDDNTELMFFVFRGDENDPSVVDCASGTYVDENGDQIPVLLDDVEIDPLSSWTSPVTGGVYPQNWNFRVKNLGLSVNLLAVMPDQEVPNQMWNYWEGLMTIEGFKGEKAVDGMGFVELSGYAGRPLLWFLFDEWWR